MTNRHILPNAASIMRLVLMKMIEDRRDGRDTEINLGSRRLVASMVNYPGSYAPQFITKPAGTDSPDIS